jgi:hypothetical protein
MTLAPLLLAAVLASGPLVREQPGRVVRVPSASSTNYALRSNSFCKTGNVADTSWTLSNATCVNDAAVDPTGGSSMDTATSTAAAGTVSQAVTFATASASATASTWAHVDSGTGYVSMITRCAGSTATACSCYASDNSACSVIVGSPAATDCVFKFPAVGTTTIRTVGTATCAAAVTGWTFYRAPGNYSSATGTARFWCGMFEPGSKVWPGCIPTEGSPVTRRR